MGQFRHEKIVEKSRYEKFWTKKVGDHRAIIGCPKGEYFSGRCNVPTELVAILHPKSEGENPGCDIKATLRTAHKFFESAVDKIKKVKLPMISGPLIEVGDIVMMKYVANNEGLEHLFAPNVKIYSKPGKNWFIAIGDFRFTERGFVDSK